MVASKLLKIVFGLILLVGSVYLFILPGWQRATIDLLQGSIVLLVFLIGLVFLLLGISELRE